MTQPTATNGQAPEPSLGELLTRFSDQVNRLVHDEVQLAVFEVKRRAKGVGAGVGILVVGLVLLLFGAGVVVAGLVALLALVLPVWLSALIIGGALLLLGVLFAVLAQGRLKRAGLPVPEEAVASMREDIQAVIRGARR